MDIESILHSLSYAGICVLMISNGLISFPSSQVLYIIVGYFIGTGYLGFLPASLIGAIGNTIGNIIQYELVRKYGIRVLRFAQIYQPSEIKKVEMVFRKKGPWFLFISKLLPAIKVFSPIPPALGKMRRDLFVSIMFFSSWVWSFIFIAIGYTFGKGATLLKTYGIVLIVFAAIIVFAFYRYMNSKAIMDEIEREIELDVPKE